MLHRKNSLKLFQLEGGAWEIEDSSQVDIPGHRVIATPSDAGTFAVMGCLPPGQVILSGPASASTNTPVTFRARVDPASLAGPFTFTWNADEHDPVEITQDSRESEVSFTWTAAGPKQVTVEVENCGGSIEASFVADINLPVPAIPVGLSASDGTFSGQILISWEQAHEAVTYRLFRSLDTTPPDNPLVELNGTTYNDTKAEAGMLYHYWVKGCNLTGCSDLSLVETGFRALEPPADLRVTDPVLSRQVTLSWQSVPEAHWYQVFRSLDDQPPVEPLADQLTSTGYQDFNVEPGAAYTYWVKACCELGCSGFSAPALGQTLAGRSVFLPLIGR